MEDDTDPEQPASTALAPVGTWMNCIFFGTHFLMQKGKKESAGLGSLISKVSGGVAVDAAFRVGQYLDIPPPPPL